MFRLKDRIIGLAGMVLILLIGITFSCQSEAQPIKVQGSKVEVNAGYYTNITADRLAAMLQNKDFLFINVHIPYDGEIEKTDLFLPYDKTNENLNLLPQDKNSKIVVYCRSGPMSTTASKVLVEAGYTNVWNLEGGMGAWKKQGYGVFSK